MIKKIIKAVKNIFIPHPSGLPVMNSPDINFKKLNEVSVNKKEPTIKYTPEKIKKPTRKSLEAMDKKAIDELAKTHGVKLDRRKKKSTMIDELLEGLK